MGWALLMRACFGPSLVKPGQDLVKPGHPHIAQGSMGSTAYSQDTCSAYMSCHRVCIHKLQGVCSHLSSVPSRTEERATVAPSHPERLTMVSPLCTSTWISKYISQSRLHLIQYSYILTLSQHTVSLSQTLVKWGPFVLNRDWEPTAGYSVTLSKTTVLTKTSANHVHQTHSGQSSMHGTFPEDSRRFPKNCAVFGGRPQRVKARHTAQRSEGLGFLYMNVHSHSTL